MNQMMMVMLIRVLEIIDYARYLGMNPREDKDLLWIAKEGLKAPLPEPWRPCRTDSQEIYYFNFETEESMLEHPCDQYYRQVYQEEKRKKMINARNYKFQVEKSKVSGGSRLLLKQLTLPESRQSEKIRLETEVILCLKT